ncbi:DUF6653 family protein [Oceaniglobus ichthyenteri]|uniref:DUF6653 family protein n=1 Tax=Oceaniglobus ichthyenteri TaxID=2136177 RepID=UPI000D39D157|nr:DUF6653 family protein [Oceaniglobus ichthyenteri]
MAVMGRLAAHFAMSDPVWDRHANPWSGLTRLPILPLMALAIYARVWIGWACLVPLALLILWAWYNPRVFAPPAHTHHWLSRAVMGERVWLNDGTVPIPAHHSRAANWLSVLAALGLAPLIWGLWVLDPWAVACGCTFTILAKLWFLDRMVWLYHDMAAHHPEYAAWLR